LLTTRIESRLVLLYVIFMFIAPQSIMMQKYTFSLLKKIYFLYQIYWK
jgi:hypothetical protein